MNKFNEFKKARELNEDGFSLIELVVAVGILAVLSVVGLIAYSGITENAREQAVNAAASEVYTAVVAYESGDAGKDRETVINEYKASSEKIVVEDTTEEGGELEITATGTWGSNSYTATKPGGTPAG